MATLEKIRSRSGLLLIIVGAALLAFIIGDFFQSGHTLFGTGTTIAKVGDQKIDVQEFQQRAQQAAQQMQGRKVDTSALNQQVLDAMISEKLFLQEAKELGLEVTDEELSATMVGRNSMAIDRMVQQNYGVPDAKTFYDIAFNPSKYGVPAAEAQQYQQAWVELENQVENMLLRQKFQNLFTGTLVGNDLDVKALYDDNASTSTIIYASQNFSTLPDEEYEPSEAEIKALYNDDKAMYALDEPVSMVNYIAVDILPSDADKAAASEKVQTALAALNTQADIPALADEFVVERAKQSASDLNNQLKNAVDSMTVGTAAIVSDFNNNYVLAKLLGRSNEITEVTLDFITYQGSRAQVDSVIALLNGGMAFDSITAAPGVAGAQKDYKVSLLDPTISELRETFETATTGRYFTPDTAATLTAARIFRVSEKAAPTEVLDLATITYEVLPSAATVNKLQSDLMDYVAANKTAKEFADSAQAAGYTTFPAQITPSSPAIGNIEDSHAGVAWVMDAKKGQVSNVMGDEQVGKFYAVAVNDIYDDDIVPLRDPQLTNNYTARARNNKKAAALIEKYNGKANDVAGYAQLMETQVDTTTVNFGQVQIPGLGVYQDEIMGAVANAKPGQLVGPLKANNSVVVLQVTGVDQMARPFDAKQDAATYERQRGASRVMSNMDLILKGNKKIKNNMTTFYK
ncbi:MAG: SurA N-terminal domain-containing protein [Lachnoclostridium sp.]|nr:SurA N-terminal domain-containing protein [Lachnoclostridium sp.]